MKICIFATPRSGSTSLVKLINSHLKIENYKMFIEPFNSFNNDGYKSLGYNFNTLLPLLNYDNLLIKNCFFANGDEYPKDTFENVNQYIDWCISYFDKIIILDRRDKVLQSESFAVNETAMRERGTNWHTPKFYDIEKIDPSYVERMVKLYNDSSEFLHKMSIKHNFPLYYYEDIYVNNDDSVLKMFEYIGIDLKDEHYNEYILSPERKVRIDIKTSKLI